MFIKAPRSGKTNNNKGIDRKKGTFYFSKPVIYIFPKGSVLEKSEETMCHTVTKSQVTFIYLKKGLFENAVSNIVSILVVQHFLTF